MCSSSIIFLDIQYFHTHSMSYELQFDFLLTSLSLGSLNHIVLDVLHS